jgi:sporulation protein YlmC with PRC-barrel domain
MVNRLYDAQVVDPRGEKIGSVKRIWLDGQTGDPLWASVHTGLFGLKESFVPLQRAELRDDKLRVPVDKEQVKESPRIEASGDHMSDDEQAALFQHYGFGPQGGMGQRQAGMDRQQRRPGSSQQSSDYPNRGQHGRQDRGTQQGQQDQGAMTRSEEQLKIGAERVETGRVRLVKHVVTEEQQVSVPVSHEEVRIEREPITDANRGHGAKIGEAEQEMR